MNEELFYRRLLHAGVFTILAPVFFLPLRLIFVSFWVYYNHPVTVGHFALVEKVKEILVSISYATGFDLMFSMVVFLRYFYFSIPAVFLFNLFGEIGLAKIHLGKKTHFVISAAFSCFAYALVWLYFFFPSQGEPLVPYW